jgi:NADP-dependent 3-hydroxy acid dehydrogenase YdfG
MTSTDTKTWLVTGAGRGMGVDFARAALAAGHNVVATGRNLDTVRTTIGDHEQLLVTELDITDDKAPSGPSPLRSRGSGESTCS